MNNLTRSALSLLGLLLLLGHAPLSAEPLKPFIAQYDLTKKITRIGKLQLSLQQEAGYWRYQSKARAVGLAAIMVGKERIEEYTLFSFNNNALQPYQYSYIRDSKKHGKQLNMDFNWADRKATVSTGKQQQDIELQNNDIDQLLLHIALMCDLQAGISKDQSREYTVLDGIERKTHRYTLVGAEVLKIADKRHKTLKLLREHGKRKTIIWFAPEQNHLIVKMERYRKDKLKSQLVLRSVEWL